MRRQDRPRRDMLLEKTLLDQRLAEHVAAHGDHESEEVILAGKEKTEQELDALMARPPTRGDRMLELGRRVIAGFRKPPESPQ